MTQSNLETRFDLARRSDVWAFAIVVVVAIAFGLLVEVWAGKVAADILKNMDGKL